MNDGFSIRAFLVQEHLVSWALSALVHHRANKHSLWLPLTCLPVQDPLLSDIGLWIIQLRSHWCIMQPRRGANESSTTPTTPLILSVPVYRLFSSLLSVWVYCLFIHPHHHCLHFSLFLSLSPFSVLLALSCLLTLSQAMHPSNVCVHVCAHTHTRVSTHTDRHAHIPIPK